MNSPHTDQLEMFSKDWYNEYFRRAATSLAHAQFCERVYGKNLCQHGLMDMQELDFLISLLKPHSCILEVGCSNGFITEYIADHVPTQILGIDFSDVAISQARERTRQKADQLRFECVDLTEEPAPGQHYDYIIAIDSLYFLGELEDRLRHFNQKLRPGGQLLLSIFQTQQEDDPPQVLQPVQTFLAQALHSLQFSYSYFDFTQNVRAHGFKNHQVAQELRDLFLEEGNTFLYEARVAENVYFRELAEKEQISRFMYVVEQKQGKNC